MRGINRVQRVRLYVATDVLGEADILVRLSANVYPAIVRTHTSILRSGIPAPACSDLLSDYSCCIMI